MDRPGGRGSRQSRELLAAWPGALLLRLLLDERYSPAIAEQLRARGHDVESVDDRDDLRSLKDPALFAAAHSERRAILTNNVRDFVPLVQTAAMQGDDHRGLLLTNDRSLPRSNRTFGTLLDGLLSANPEDDALLNRTVWPP